MTLTVAFQLLADGSAAHLFDEHVAHALATIRHDLPQQEEIDLLRAQNRLTDLRGRSW